MVGSGAQATYAYDANGNLSTTTYNNNTSATYTYNSGNLPTQVQNKRSTTVLSRYSYTYGLDGNQLTKSDNSGRTTTYTYDGLNRLTKEVRTGTGAFTNSYTYDDYSNRATATLAGAATSYTYDVNNRLLTDTQGKNTTSYDYDDQGNMTSTVFKYNGSVQNTVNYTYDGFGRLKKVRDSNGETLYTYDADGRRTSKQTADGIQYYVWDGDQLAVTISPRVDPFFTLTLPSSGRVEDEDVPITSWTTYYAKVDGKVYSAMATYDSGQAELFRARPDKDDPIPIEPPDPVPETYTELSIGGFEFSISNKTKRGTVYGPAGKTIELYENDPSTALPTVSYVRGLSLVAAVQDGTRTYYHYNAHGDVVQLTNSSGTVTKNYTYDAFGVEQDASDSDANPFRYCGEQYDSETGNYYLRARYYSPGVGRFTQEDTHWNPGNMIYGDEPQKWNEWQGEEDPLNLHAYTYKPEATAVAQAGNLYGYAKGNPVAYIDVNGFWVAGAGSSVSGGFIGYVSASDVIVLDGQGNVIEILAGTAGGGTPSVGYGVFGTWSSASNVFEYANGVSFSSGGSGGAATVSISGEFNMGKQTDGSMFAGGSVGASWSPSNLAVPLEGHAGFSTAKIQNIILYKGKPLPEDVTIDYFSDLPYEIQQKIANDLNLTQPQQPKKWKDVVSGAKTGFIRQYKSGR